MCRDTAVRKLAAVPAALLVGVVAGAAVAVAGGSNALSDIPRFKIFVSSHSTAAAEVLAYHGVKKELPQVVLIGGLEGRIYRCDCGKDIHLWDIAGGTRLWAAAQGLTVNTQSRVLRGAKEGEALDLAQYRAAIDAGQPVILTYSLDEASGKGMEASFRSQDRVSVVGIGYDEANPDRSQGTAGGPSTLLRTNGCATHGESDPDGYVIVSLPEDADKDKRFAQLAALPGVKPGEREGLLLIPWDVQTGNRIATFVEAPE